MLRKTFIFFAVLTVCVSCGDAFAVASVKQLGTNVATGAEKPVSITPSLPKANPVAVKAVKPQVTVKDTDEPARLSALSTIKTVNTARIKQPVNAVSSSQAGSYAASEEAVHELAARVEALEQKTQNAFIGVVEEGSGSHVTDVSAGADNKLNVTKTRLLYAPVRQGNSDTIVSDAEIWLVK